MSAVKLPPLQYVAPRSLAQACDLLAADEDAKVLAGGQSLMPLLAIRLSSPSTLIDLAHVPDLVGVDEAGSYLHIRAMTTHQQVITSPIVREHLPFVAEAGAHIAHAQIRSRGTLGGSIAHGDGAAEWPLTVLTLDAMVEVEGVRGRRTIESDDLFVGPYMTSIAPDEVVTDVWIPKMTVGWSFQEIARRAGDYGLALVGVSTETGPDGTCTSARITVGAAAGTVQRVPAAEDSVVGNALDEHTARRAGETARESLSFISDIHGSSNYRGHLVQTLVTRALIEAGARR
ncbi:FAD binding domain-containing protein [Rhodococcus opacus]|uniref:FAD binding domain-containing protein n=1 Tax=Rhodococcus opacus TaxID=37919 RepID=UPI001D033DCC|nr:xanthine dehydrogenase family protein subunit M [Rhodococcus opacus]